MATHITPKAYSSAAAGVGASVRRLERTAEQVARVGATEPAARVTVSPEARRLAEGRARAPAGEARNAPEPSEGSDLTSNMTGMLTARTSLAANVAVARTAEDMDDDVMQLV